MSQEQYDNLPQGRRPPGRTASLPRQHAPPPQVGEGSTNPSGGGSGYASGDSSGKSPLHLGLEFLKGLGSERKNRDGQPQKRRGPKPDSKPALTRRQELNRHAQRTHRERKEVYIKTLEQEVMQLKEVYTGSIQEKEAIADENKKLKELLQLHGIAFDSGAGLGSGYTTTNPASSSGQLNTSYGFQSGSSFSPHSQSISSTGGTPDPYVPLNDPSLGSQLAQQQQQPQPGLDYDQIGVDFVLASVSHQQQQQQHHHHHHQQGQGLHQDTYPAHFSYQNPHPQQNS